MTNGLSQAELEEAYDLIAGAIDRAGSENESLFLAKLCLALANGASDVASVRRAIEIAMDKSALVDSQGPAAG